MRILIADDHTIVRRGLKQLIAEDFPSAVIGESEDAEDLIKKINAEDWDLVISDLSMPGRSGIDALIQIRQMKPVLPVLIMSMHSEDHYAIRVLKAGAVGFLGKDSIHMHLTNAIQNVLAGKKYITSSIAEKLAKAIEKESNKDPHEFLSNREFEVFVLLASGKTTSEISEKLSISGTTVSTYRFRILEKMGLKNNSDIIVYALEHKLV